MQRLAGIDITIVLLYLVGLLVTGLVLGRKQKTDRDYFLGGRKLKWPMVGISMVVSDIGALELVSVAGSAYVMGLSIANFDWIGCVPAMIAAAFIFIPFYWRSGGHSLKFATGLSMRYLPMLLRLSISWLWRRWLRGC